MISATGKRSIHLRSKAAFSIFEVLLVLILIVLVAGVFAINFDVILRGFGNKQPAVVMHEVVREARYLCAHENARVILRYDKEKQSFLIEKAKDAKEPLAEYATSEPYIVAFSPKEPKSRRRGRNVIITTGYKDVVNSIEFWPDGVSTPVRIHLLVEGEAYAFDLDPFSSGLTLVDRGGAT